MILDDIAEARKIQLKKEKEALPFEEARSAAEKSPAGKDFKAAVSGLKGRLSVIAEVKKASPSKGVISESFNPLSQAVSYEKSGADAVSCLTEERYFLGKNEYLSDIAKTVSIPVLRKDFITDPYQIYHAKVMGADAVLLIAALLETGIIKEFRAIAEELGLSVLAETHSESEIESVLSAGCSIIGINNRDLRTFEVNINTTERLIKYIPKGYAVISESGLKSTEDLKSVREWGASGVLIGETFMRSGKIEDTFAELMKGQ